MVSETQHFEGDTNFLHLAVGMNYLYFLQTGYN
jgi:hypothetical protein